MAYTFFKAKGTNVGDSLVEEELVDKAREILALAEKKGVQFVLPDDIVITDKISESAKSEIVESALGVPEGKMGVDIGPKTVETYKDILKDAKLVFWNGPLGVFEIPAFANGTREVAKAVSKLDATTIVGGGDSAAAIQEAGVASKITHISTGGGASLEYIEYGRLPGIEALSPAKTSKLTH
jgi:phosphoglycerate kinase